MGMVNISTSGGAAPMRRVFGLALSGIVILVGLTFAPQPPRAEALSASQFDAGNLISDADFYNGNAMGQSEIQAFLDAKIGACNNGLCLNVLTENVASRSRLVSDSTGNLRCDAFQGGLLSAAAIIYRAQLACGISAKVILVTLQKEQGLVTSKSPSQPTLDRAMGQGCPDNSGGTCSSLYFGFGNQVYSAALQLNTYRASRFSIQPGNNLIRYSPSADPSCNGTVINIQNFATAALYAYTPYQPDPQALSTLTGSVPGDICAAYGNRNFWVYYNTWFGLSPAPGPIADLYASMGGSAGVLGPVQASVENLSGNGGGIGQRFLNGSIMSSPTVGTSAILNGAIRNLYFAQGGPSGPDGWPAANVETFTGGGGGQGQRFQNASIMSASNGVAVTMLFGPIRDLYFSLGGPSSPLGWPGSGIESFSGGGGGTGERFDDGSIMSSPTAGTFVISNGPIRDQYFAQAGPSGPLGWPTVAATCVGTACSQQFQGGTITPDQITALYWSLGGVSGVLGPVGSTVEAFAGGGGGTGQRFANGSIMSSPTAGTFAILNGPLRDFYFALSGPSSSLGWPAANVQAFQGGTGQRFQNGTLMSSSAVGTTILEGGIRDTYFALGGPSSSLGWPEANVESFSGGGGGTGQRFQTGSIMSSPTAGTFALANGSVRDQYFGIGGPSSVLGWPTDAQVCPTSGCTQKFQGGTLDPGQIAALHTTLGGNTGPLGIVNAGVEYFLGGGGGTGQRFANGSIMSSPAAGTFALVNGPVRDAYFAQGGPSGALGWVTSAQNCTGAICTQTFQGGTLTK